MKETIKAEQQNFDGQYLLAAEVRYVKTAHAAVFILLCNSNVIVKEELFELRRCAWNYPWKRYFL
jgi:hypothetical protein